MAQRVLFLVEQLHVTTTNLSTANFIIPINFIILINVLLQNTDQLERPQIFGLVDFQKFTRIANIVRILILYALIIYTSNCG